MGGAISRGARLEHLERSIFFRVGDGWPYLRGRSFRRVRVAPGVALSPEERASLRRLRARGGPKGRRAEFVLLAAEGLANLEVARRRGVSRQTVARWRRRFLTSRLRGLDDRPSKVRQSRISEERLQAIVRATVTRRPHGRSSWSTRSLAREFGVSHMTVRRIWDAYRIRPRQFDVVPSRPDPVPPSAPWDVVGLALGGPTAFVAVVLRPVPPGTAPGSTPAAGAGRRGPDPDPRDRAGSDPAFQRLEPGRGPAEATPVDAHDLVRFLAEIDSRLPSRPQVRVVVAPRGLADAPGVTRWRVRHPTFELVAVDGLAAWKQRAGAEVAEVGRARAPHVRFEGRAEVSHSLARTIGSLESGTAAFEWLASPADLVAGEAAYWLRYALAVTGQPIFKNPARLGRTVPALPGIDEKLRASARRILRENLRVRPGERVTIEAWTETLPYGNAFVLESLRLGARPLLLYQDEPTYWAAATEVSAKSLAAVGEHRKAALERTDAFVTFFGPSDRERFHALPTATRFRLGEYQDSLYEAAARAGARAVQMAIGRVSAASARMYEVDATTWRDELLDGTLVDPKLLRRRAAAVARRLARGREMTITHPNGTELRLRLRGRKPFVSDGTVRQPTSAGNWSLVTLPAGVVTVAVDERTADGTFRSNVRSSGGLSDAVGEFAGGSWTFADGRLTRFVYELGQEAFSQSYARAKDGRDRPSSVSIGLNERIVHAPLLEDQGLGTITMHLGRNDHVGGATRSGWWAWLFLRGGELRVDGELVVRAGTLVG
jgi:leucyl aminopeptidase (aminopeptidase T)/transposase